MRLGLGQVRVRVVDVHAMLNSISRLNCLHPITQERHHRRLICCAIREDAVVELHLKSSVAVGVRSGILADG